MVAARQFTVLLLLATTGWGAEPPDRRRAAVPISGGTFRMGTDADEVAGLLKRLGVSDPDRFQNEMPVHKVTLSDFHMDPFEVTNEDFLAFVSDVPQWAPGRLPAGTHNGHYLRHWADGRYPPGRASHPVVFVTWNAAQAFCRRAGGRLPTEAEWEYAARAGGAAEFPWGDAIPDPTLANYQATGVEDTLPVGRFPSNAVGLHDMAGNVWEFLLDRWEPTYRAGAVTNPIAGGPVPDEAIAAVTGRRAVRGASYAGSVLNLRTRWRDSHVVSNAAAFVGFRCAYPE